MEAAGGRDVTEPERVTSSNTAQHDISVVGACSVGSVVRCIQKGMKRGIGTTEISVVCEVF
jgi:hypothetical protein